MRQRWEDKGDEMDEPVTITEKELRSLKMGARAGLFALILSLIAAGAAGWTIYLGTKAAPAPHEAEVTQTPAPAVADSANSQPAAMTPEPAPAAASPVVETPAAKTSVAPAAPRHTVKAVNAASVGHARYGRATASRRGPAPKMESFDPAPASPSTGVPTQTPLIPVAPVKSAPADSSHR